VIEPELGHPECNKTCERDIFHLLMSSVPFLW
jgi:hypothetical protein